MNSDFKIWDRSLTVAAQKLMRPRLFGGLNLSGGTGHGEGG